MKKKSKTTPTYYTIGVRFLDGMHIAKVYTYRIHNNHTVLLGQELIADTPRGSVVVVVVRIDKVPQDTVYGVDYKHITRKVSPL